MNNGESLAEKYARTKLSKESCDNKDYLYKFTVETFLEGYNKRAFSENLKCCKSKMFDIFKLVSDEKKQYATESYEYVFYDEQDDVFLNNTKVIIFKMKDDDNWYGRFYLGGEDIFSVKRFDTDSFEKVERFFRIKYNIKLIRDWKELVAN